MTTSASVALASITSSMLQDQAQKIVSCMPGVPSRWFFPLEQLHANSPSVQAGINVEKELLSRQQAASFIHDLGTKLHLPHWVMNVAVVYMHRFYVFHSFKRFYKNDVAAAALFLAAKVEEMPRKLEHVVKISYALQHRDEPEFDKYSVRYDEETQKIATYENILLQTLGFDLNVEVPNTFVVKRIEALNAPKALAFTAYHFTTDSLHLTTLCLRYRPSVVACACMFLACNWARWEMPVDSKGNSWYSHLDPEVTPDILQALADELVTAFQRCPEKLRHKRHLASIKRDRNGAIIPASVLIDRDNGASLAEFHSGSAASALPCSTGATSSSMTSDADSVTSTGASSKVLLVEDAEAGKIFSSHQNHKSDVSSTPPTSVNAGAGAATDSPSQLRQEISKVDLKSYKERMKDRKLERLNDAAETSAVLASARKSFMPDMSSTRSNSWLLEPSVQTDKPETEVISRTWTNSRSTTNGSQKMSNHRRDRNGSHRHSHRYDDEKRSTSSHSSQFNISLKAKACDDHHDSSVRKSESLSRSQAEYQEQSTATFDRVRKEKSPTYSDNSNPVNGTAQAPAAKKRSYEDYALSNGYHEFGARKLPKVIDYEHGAHYSQRYKYVTDYEHGAKIVTDYQHGGTMPQIPYFSNKEIGYEETNAISSTNGSYSFSSTRVSQNSSSSKDEKLMPNESDASNTSLDKDKSTTKNGYKSDEGKHCRLLKADGKRNADDGASLTSRGHRNLLSTNQRIQEAIALKTEGTAFNVSGLTTLSTFSAIRSVVGSQIPDDDVLRQAAQKAKQMQRLERLKSMKFDDLPIVSVSVQLSDLTERLNGPRS